MDTYARWNSMETEKRAGLPPLVDPTTLPGSAMTLRIRRELVARDAINSRAWDNFHATPPTQVSSDQLRQNGRPVYFDMNPQASRTNTVKYRIQPEYIPDVERGPTRSGDLGVPPAPSGAVSAPSNTFSGNPYTQRLDAAGSDSRNMMRELRGAVVEDNRDVTVDIDRHLADRQFYDRWLAGSARSAIDPSSLQAYELLRPKQDSWREEWKN